MRLTLVSASPRRRELLSELSIPFDVQATETAEKWLASDPICLAKLNARRKVERSRFFGDRSRLLIGADTIIAIHGQILGKPIGPESARRMLNQLSGRRHDVITGVCLSGPSDHTGDPLFTMDGAAVTCVEFRVLTPLQIANYITDGEWKGKAGAYAIQGEGRNLIESWNGDYNNVVGLPLELIRNAIAQYYSHCRFL